MEKYYLIIDIEATCWSDRNQHRGESEIIEIGYALLSPDKTLVMNEGLFVRPQRNPILSEFCKTLTSIKQEDVESAPTFIDTMEILHQRVCAQTDSSIEDCLFVSWGDYDRNQFKRDCDFHRYPYPFGEHFNIKNAFASKYNTGRIGMDEALKFLNFKLMGTHHRGKDDALNISRIFLEYLG